MLNLLREFVKKINRERGVTILLTTRNLQDIEELEGHCLLQREGLHVRIQHDSRVSSSDMIVTLMPIAMMPGWMQGRLLFPAIIRPDSCWAWKTGPSTGLGLWWPRLWR